MFETKKELFLTEKLTIPNEAGLSSCRSVHTNIERQYDDSLSLALREALLRLDIQLTPTPLAGLILGQDKN